MLAVFSYRFVKGWEQELLRADFDRQAQNCISVFSTQVNNNLFAVQSLATFFRSSSRVTPQEFREFAGPMLEQYPGVQAFAWVPRVVDSERAALESEKDRTGLASFQILEQQDQGALVRAGRREQYFPVRYVAPQEGSQAVLGVDLASSGVAGQVLQQAGDSGQIISTTGFRLVEDFIGGSGLLVCQPVYRRGLRLESVEVRRQQLMGFVIGVFRVGTMLKGAMARLEFPLMDIDVLDDDSRLPFGQRLLHRYLDRNRTLAGSVAEAPLGGLEYSSVVRVADRKWRLICQPSPPFLAEINTWQSSWVPLAVLLITLVLMGYMWFILDHAERSRRHVAEMSSAKAALEREVAEHEAAEREKAKLESELRQAQKMQAVGTLADGIAHDFNNILGIILGSTEMACEELPADHPVRSDLQEVMVAGNRAKELVKQILVFSRQGRQQRRPIEMRAVVEETVAVLRSSIPASVEIRLEIAQDCGPVLADPAQIHQLLVNLCTNSVHAMQEKGVLEIFLRRTRLGEEDVVHRPDMAAGTCVELAVRDNGVGMDAAVIERIFEPFFTTKGVGDGIGMGLSVVHGIVEAHGGMITVASSPGAGAEFRVFLPETEPEASAATIAVKPLPGGQGHILYVDPEAMMANMVRRMLERLGYRVTTATTSASALELFQARPTFFDVVIADQAMPQQSGLELGRGIRVVRPECPVILSTGYCSRAFREQAEAAGIRELVQKPILGRHLAEAVRRVLEDAIQPVFQA